MLFNVRVYYADTDAGGIVYHSKYLDFCERARTELLRENGFIQSKMSVGFVVKNAEIEYKKSAKLDDLLTIKTDIVENKGVVLKLKQEITKDNDLIFTMNINLVCVNMELKPVRMPKEILDKFLM
ncbi:MAG: tol-pal system-associated acyl-CoA thioesterase [Rickettsiales bacterium]|nr:MAG: tol-pal system-associated acyl-CoA thioesterase [Rickettsiales bacterium]